MRGCAHVAVSVCVWCGHVHSGCRVPRGGMKDGAYILLVDADDILLVDADDRSLSSSSQLQSFSSNPVSIIDETFNDVAGMLSEASTDRQITAWVRPYRNSAALKCGRRQRSTGLHVSPRQVSESQQEHHHARALPQAVHAIVDRHTTVQPKAGFAPEHPSS